MKGRAVSVLKASKNNSCIKTIKKIYISTWISGKTFKLELNISNRKTLLWVT